MAESSIPMIYFGVDVYVRVCAYVCVFGGLKKNKLTENKLWVHYLQ